MTNGLLEVLIDNAFEVAAVALATYLAPRAAEFLAGLAKKYHFQAGIIKQQQIEAFILQQIMRVKEEVAEALKQQLPVAKGEAKLESVVEATLDKFPGISIEEAEQLTKALLSSVGEGATQLSQAAINQMQAQMFGGGGITHGPTRVQ